MLPACTWTLHHLPLTHPDFLTPVVEVGEGEVGCWLLITGPGLSCTLPVLDPITPWLWQP